jgi:3-oxoacyl-[acyl-carrier protein] reductase
MILEGKRIIVTGGVTGIGRATTLACAREGASVVSLSTAAPDRHRVTRIAEQIADGGTGRYMHLQVDMGVRASTASSTAPPPRLSSLPNR